MSKAVYKTNWVPTRKRGKDWVYKPVMRIIK